MARRKSKRDATGLLVFLFVFAVAGSSLGLTLAKLVAFAIVILVLAVIVGIFLIIWNLPKNKGKRGESSVARVLERTAAKCDGYVINDVIIPGQNGATSQIDHILFTRRGIFVVETKNYAGRLYGDGKQRQWTQVLAYGNTKNKMYNPMMQNQTHIYNLMNIVDEDVEFFSCVVILEADISYLENADEVYTLRELKQMLKSEAFNEVYKEATIIKAYNSIVEYKTNPIASEKEHVKNIKKTQLAIENNICPRCGGKLVLRTSKQTGNQFYGCENYPECKFTKKE